MKFIFLLFIFSIMNTTKVNADFIGDEFSELENPALSEEYNIMDMNISGNNFIKNSDDETVTEGLSIRYDMGIEIENDGSFSLNDETRKKLCRSFNLNRSNNMDMLFSVRSLRLNESAQPTRQYTADIHCESFDSADSELIKVYGNINFKKRSISLGFELPLEKR